MQPHFKERNVSSHSLEGMERPVRSFKSFIQTTPPHPTETDRSLPSLPLTRPAWKTAHSHREQAPTPPSVGHSTPDRDSSIVSWKASAKWYNDGASGQSVQNPSPPSLAPRKFAPFIPEPSPGLPSMMGSEPTAWIALSSPPANRLLPTYERTNGSLDIGPPGSPPKSPLPVIPPFKDRPIENTQTPEHRRANSFSSIKVVDTEHRMQALSCSRSDASTKEKAFASLGLDSSDSSQRGRKRAYRTYLRGKKLRALCKGSPLADNSWDDEDMDDRTRELSFSQDYHDLLADQYQEMNVRAQEVLSSGGAHQVYEAQFDEPKSRPVPRDHDLVPRPLPWQKSSGQNTPRNQSHDREVEDSSGSGPKSKHKRLFAFLPNRLGALELNKEENTKKERRCSKSKHIPTSEVDQVLHDDLRFSKFFPSSRPDKFGKKNKKATSVKSPPVPSSPPQSNPLMRLPRGLAVFRTHSPSPAPKSDVLSDKSTTSQHTHNSSQYGSEYSRTNSDHRSSYHSHDSQAPTIIPMPIRSAYRMSGGSSYSHRSSTSHPLAQEVSPSHPPQPPPVIPSSPPQSPPLSLDSVNRLRGHDKSADHAMNCYTPKLFEKAKEACRRRATEARQDKLKRSIKVLGPTDPAIAQSGYVKSEDQFEQGDSDVEGRFPRCMVRSEPV